MRGHATGPFDKQSNLRVQNVLILTPNTTKQLFIEASPIDPVLLLISPNVDSAITGGTNSLLIGTSTDDNAYFDTGDTTPGTPGLATAKRFVLTAATTLVAKLTSLAIAAAKALTISAITGANTQTVTIGGVTYTFNTALTNTANNVLIGADATAMGANLAAAINAGAGAGTTYGTGTVANPSVTASASLGVVTVTARTPGSSGNAIAIAETLTNGSWAGGATTLSGGANAATAGQMTVFIDA
jgi:hypothetical protein